MAFRLKWYWVLSLNINLVDVFDALISSENKANSTERLNITKVVCKLAIFITNQCEFWTFFAEGDLCSQAIISYKLLFDFV